MNTYFMRKWLYRLALVGLKWWAVEGVLLAVASKDAAAGLVKGADSGANGPNAEAILGHQCRGGKLKI